MTIHERRAARALYVALPTREPFGDGRPDLHARRASQEFLRMWQKAVNAQARKARRFRGVRHRHTPAVSRRELAQGWCIE